jgi:hypothetical protein
MLAETTTRKEEADVVCYCLGRLSWRPLAVPNGTAEGYLRMPSRERRSPGGGLL